MTLQQRIHAFVQVGGFIKRHMEGQYRPEEAGLHAGLTKVIEVAGVYNNWFIPNFVNKAIQNIGLFLTEEALEGFCKTITDKPEKTVAVVCAGNIPLVCFHDVMCVLLCNHKALIKLSSDDNVLPPFFLKLLSHYEPGFESKILFADGKLGQFDGILATGSDNTASHLHYYFGKYPNIIRKSRTSLALLKGDESREELTALGADIFDYFGLGCRNVSKVLVPKDYVFDSLFECIVDYGFVVNNKKYGNNYDYHRAIYLLEQQAFLDNNFLMVKQSSDLYSPVGVLYFDYYQSEKKAKAYLEKEKEHLQCVVGKGHVAFGYSQRPVITDFADNINTLDFLVNL
jgi:hypothetical protein